MIVLLLALGIVGLAAISLILVKAKELHDYGYSWGYSFFKLFGGLK